MNINENVLKEMAKSLDEGLEKYINYKMQLATPDTEEEKVRVRKDATIEFYVAGIELAPHILKRK